MLEKDKVESSDAEAPPVDYAFWDVPGESCKVIYSLPLFHEIDFVVNEGYRKIPHGGIEVGGLLFGSIDKDIVRIEAFRDIDCEHASGPSLNFSDRDLAELKKQIAAAATDPDLAKFKPIGWFLTHTRAPLELTEVEAKQFDEFFPNAFNVTVLVKPERFQPTRFAFLVRNSKGQMPREASSLAVILPLPGRSHRAGQLIPSLPAPAPSNNAKRAIERSTEKEGKAAARQLADDLDDDLLDEKPAGLNTPKKEAPKKEASKKAPEPLPMSIWKVPPDAPDETEDYPPVVPPEDLPTSAERAARRQLSRDRARIIGQAFPPLPPPPPAAPFRPAALPSLPANSAIPIRSAYDRYPQTANEFAGAPNAQPESVLNPRSVTALALAALLGCLVGYIAYLQLPAPVIPIDVRSVNQTVVISWPPNETRNSVYAAVRLNDGPPVPLSADERKAGQVSLTATQVSLPATKDSPPATKDFKVEVVARNWIRDSRGIVRYLHSANGNGQVVPVAEPAP